MAGVWGSWRRPRRGVLVPDVDRTGLPLTELLPYTKIETKKEIKKQQKEEKKKKNKEKKNKEKSKETGQKTSRRGG